MESDAWDWRTARGAPLVCTEVTVTGNLAAARFYFDGDAMRYCQSMGRDDTAASLLPRRKARIAGAIDDNVMH